MACNSLVKIYKSIKFYEKTTVENEISKHVRFTFHIFKKHFCVTTNHDTNRVATRIIKLFCH